MRVSKTKNEKTNHAIPPSPDKGQSFLSKILRSHWLDQPADAVQRSSRALRQRRGHVRGELYSCDWLEVPMCQATSAPVGAINSHVEY
jgi:hypothetical protein